MPLSVVTAVFAFVSAAFKVPVPLRVISFTPPMVEPLPPTVKALLKLVPLASCRVFRIECKVAGTKRIIIIDF